MTYQLADVDLRRLRVFAAVVECGGFTRAQARLNIGQSTISAHVANLEHRLGIRLCERGRSGFRLTRKGRRVYEETIELFKLHQNFANVAVDLRNTLLRVAIVGDHFLDSGGLLASGLRRFGSRSYGASFERLSEKAALRALLRSDVDVALGPFNVLPGELHGTRLFAQASLFYASVRYGHARSASDLVDQCMVVSRGSTAVQEALSLGIPCDSNWTVIDRLDIAAALISAGTHVGFLPVSFAEQWQRAGELLAIQPSDIHYSTVVQLVVRRDSLPNGQREAFIADLQAADVYPELG